MYAGELVESSSVNDIFLAPWHPYSRGLISCVPKMGACKDTERLNSIEGQVWPAYIQPPGCIFEPRCPFSEEVCRAGHPQLEQQGNGRSVRCFRWQELTDCGCFSAEPASSEEPFVRKAGAAAGTRLRAD